METRLSEDIVYSYIKNFCYDPVYTVVSNTITSQTDISKLSFQFSADTIYVPGSYVVKEDVLYKAIAISQGSWAAESIANTFTGDAKYLGEAITADVEDAGDYDPSRFTPVPPLDDGETLTVYELHNTRTDVSAIAFNTIKLAREYIRKYTKPSDYDIHVNKISSDTYLGTWDDKSIIFYD